MKKIAIILVVIALGAGGYFWYKSQKYQKEAVPQAVDLSAVATKTDLLGTPATSQQSQQDKNPTQETSKQAALPDSLNLKMQFYAQAPDGNWDYPWQEACEEASVLLVANTYLNKNWTREEFKDHVLTLVDWENQYFGDYKHTTVKQTAEMLKEKFNLETVIHENPTYQQVKEILNQGHLIIMTFAGKRLGNPFYTNGGPNYHAMVVKGYMEDEKLIMEDVGTRRGEDYVYKWGVIQNALHDYDEPIENGAKRMIEVLPPITR
jgi:hypothetical protein